MGDYEWQKNEAIVDRMAYFEYTVKTCLFFGVPLAVKDLWYIQANFYPHLARRRLKIVLISLLSILRYLWLFVHSPLGSAFGL